MNNIKVILLDVDGIIITGRKCFFSERLSKEYDVPIEKINKFFLNDFKDCTFGRTDLKEKIAPYLIEWGWKGDVDDLLEYWFSSESTIDKEVLNLVIALRSKGIKCCLATRQEKYRLKYLWETIGLKNYFDDIFCTCDIGYDKWQKEFFEFVFNKLKVQPQEIMFFDDSQKNIDFASQIGISAFYYENVDTLKKNINYLL